MTSAVSKEQEAVRRSDWSHIPANCVVYATLGTYVLLLLRLGSNYLNAPATHGEVIWNFFVPVIVFAEFMIGYDRVAFHIMVVGLALALVFALATIWRLRREEKGVSTCKRMFLVIFMVPLVLPLGGELKMLLATKKHLVNECELNLPDSAHVRLILWPPRFTGSEITRSIRLSMDKKDVQAFFSRTNSPLDDGWERHGCEYDMLVRHNVHPGEEGYGFSPGKLKKYVQVEWEPVACSTAEAIIELDGSNRANLYIFVWVRYPEEIERMKRQGVRTSSATALDEQVHNDSIICDNLRQSAVRYYDEWTRS